MNNKVYEIVQQQILDMLEKSEKEGKIHWIKPWQLTIFRNRPKITVKYFDTGTLEIKQTQMYIDGFKSGLQKDTSFKGLWTVSWI